TVAGHEAIIEPIGSVPKPLAGPVTFEIDTFAGSGIVFNNTFTANVTAAYKTCILNAEADIARHWTDNATITVSFDAQNAGTNNFLATNNFSIFNFSYAQLTAALAAHANNADAIAATASLAKLSDPTGGAGFWLPGNYANFLRFNVGTTT